MRIQLLGGWMVCALLAVAAAHGQSTEWPTTVAPGRFLLEMDALSVTVNHDGSGKYTALGAASTFISTGLTPTWDVQVGAELFLSQKFSSGGLTERNSGIGDVYFRTKWRFYEDANGTAVALLPYLKLPTNSGGVGNKSTEGGLIVPASFALAGGVTAYTMAELDFLRNDADTGYDSFWYTSMALYRDVTKAIGLYGEMTLGKSAGGAPWEGTIGAGVLLSVTENRWWDFSITRGISRGASDWNHVIRVHWEF